jgi:hypothetical protein
MSEEPKDAEGAEAGSESARRDFLTKAAAAAGMLAATGLVAGMLNTEAEARTAMPAAEGSQYLTVRDAPVKYARLKNGHSLEITSKELASVLAREGLISKEFMGKQLRMQVMVFEEPPG